MKKAENIVNEIAEFGNSNQNFWFVSTNNALDAIRKTQTEAYNQALKDFYEKLIVSSKFTEYDKKLECWSNKDELLKTLKK